MKLNYLWILVLSLVAMSCNGADKQTDNKQVETTKQETETTTMKVIHLTKAEFLNKVANYESNPSEWKYLGDKPCIIDFYATWCGPCKRLSPVLDELAAEYGDKIYIYKVDVDEEQELAGVFGVRSVPTLLFVPMNGDPQMAQGALPMDDLKNVINDVLLK